MGNSVIKPHYKAPCPKTTNGEQILDGMSWQTIHNSTADTKLITIDVENLVPRIRKSKIIELL
jgi:hypothetical protein